jgi:hypothetical protein
MSQSNGIDVLTGIVALFCIYVLPWVFILMIIGAL